MPSRDDILPHSLYKVSGSAKNEVALRRQPAGLRRPDLRWDFRSAPFACPAVSASPWLPPTPLPAPGAGYPEPMNWNDAAEDFLNQVLAQTPRPVREDTERQLRAIAEMLAEEEGKQRVGVETVIGAWVRNTPETLRADLPRQMERFGLDPDEYRHVLE